MGRGGGGGRTDPEVRVGRIGGGGGRVDKADGPERVDEGLAGGGGGCFDCEAGLRGRTGGGVVVWGLDNTSVFLGGPRFGSGGPVFSGRTGGGGGGSVFCARGGPVFCGRTGGGVCTRAAFCVRAGGGGGGIRWAGDRALVAYVRLAGGGGAGGLDFLTSSVWKSLALSFSAW